MWNIISLLATRQLYDYRALCWGAGHHDSIDTFSCNFLEISPLISDVNMSVAGTAWILRSTQTMRATTRVRPRTTQSTRPGSPREMS